jgi:hypothetical protein
MLFRCSSILVGDFRILPLVLPLFRSLIVAAFRLPWFLRFRFSGHPSFIPASAHLCTPPSIASLSRTMELDMHPLIADTAADSHESTLQDTLPCLPTPSPPAPPPDVAIVSPRGGVNCRPRRSAVWDHFVRTDDYATTKKASCMHCSRVVTVSGGSTSTMLSHLKHHHRDLPAETTASPDK